MLAPGDLFPRKSENRSPEADPLLLHGRQRLRGPVISATNVPVNSCRTHPLDVSYCQGNGCECDAHGGPAAYRTRNLEQWRANLAEWEKQRLSPDRSPPPKKRRTR